MRLRDIHSILIRTSDDLTVQIESVGGPQQQQQNNRRISNFRKAIDGTALIRSAGVLEYLCDEVLAIEEAADSKRSTLVVPIDTANRLHSALTRLKEQADLLSGALASVLGPDEPETVAIKIPENLDLVGAAKILQELDEVLSQSLLNDYVKGNVVLEGFDRGSEWLLLALGSLTAVNVLGQMVRLHFSIEEKKLDIEAKREIVRGMKIKNESLEDFESALKKELDLHLRIELDSVYKAGKIPKKANEERQRIKHSIEIFGELLRKGLEVQPSLATPEKSRVLFPQVPRYLKEVLALPEKNEEELKDAD